MGLPLHPKGSGRDQTDSCESCAGRGYHRIRRTNNLLSSELVHVVAQQLKVVSPSSICLQLGPRAVKCVSQSLDDDPVWLVEEVDASGESATAPNDPLGGWQGHSRVAQHPEELALQPALGGSEAGPVGQYRLQSGNPISTPASALGE